MDRKQFLSFLFGLGGLAVMLWHLFEKPSEELPPPPKILGRYEGCISCHKEVTGFSESHRPEAIGCASCHLGNPFTLNKEKAHRGIILVPGNLDESRRTCGIKDCHPEITEKIETSLMATGRGMVTVNRYVFGETDSPDGEGHLSRLRKTGAEGLLRGLCASCHLHQPKRNPGPVNQTSHGGGCVACHIHYSEKAEEELEMYIAEGDLPKHHPALTIQITDAHCFGCHSRSSRIATNYEGWHDTLTTPDTVPDKENFRLLDDGRLFVKMAEDFHHEKGLLCIDCHGWQETMGDGKSYNHQEEQVKITCMDCHFMGEARTKGWSDLSEQDRKILKLRKREVKEQRFLVTAKEDRPIVNAVMNDKGEPVLIGKNSSKVHPLKPPLTACGEAIKGHERLSCQSCHSAWAPHCIRCHTEYDPSEEGYDHLEERWKKGAWIEYIDRSEIPPGDHLADPPTLGVRGDKIDTFIPGMILTIDVDKSDDHLLFRRLYAPTSPHTSVKKSRSCESCHNDPLALGYGRGNLQFSHRSDGKGVWSFTPFYSLRPEDKLPSDAWIGFLQTRLYDASTRRNARPLNREEQIRVLRVGACLTCHKSDTLIINPIYFTFEKSLAGMSNKCVPSRWDQESY